MKKVLLILLLLLFVSGCNITNNNKNDSNDNNVLEPSTPSTPDDSSVNDGITTNKYGNFTISSLTTDYEMVNNKLTISKGGEYTLSGVLNGSIIVSSSVDASVTLYLNNLVISTKDYHGIHYMSENGKLEIKAFENSTNSITVNPNSSKVYSAIESENNIEIGGSGKLVLKGYQRHAVKGSNIEIKGNVILEIEAVKDGLHGKQILISGGFTTINNCTDAIQAEVNNNNLKGTILIEEGNLTISNCKRAFRANTSLTITPLSSSSVNINVSKVEEAIDTPKVNYNGGIFKINGVDYK